MYSNCLIETFFVLVLYLHAYTQYTPDIAGNPFQFTSRR